ncbi:MAG: FtsQ-type POTRA domain-containing protein [Luteolibacter sp.]
MKRQTTKVRRHSRSQVLEVRVMSRRIAWFTCLRFLKHGMKFAVILAILGAAGWGVWYGVQKAFYQNPDFSLREIDLNPNPVLDHEGFVDAAGISLPTNLFGIHVEEAAERLKKLPAVADAKVERHLPDKLFVRVTARVPKAWISCPSAGFAGKREAGGLLVDRDGFVFACPKMALADAAKLPVVEISRLDQTPISVGKKFDHPELARCFRLMDAATESDPQACESVELIRQTNEWSLALVTKEGTVATFGLADHARQIANLRAALDHAARQGYLIKTINLIPKENVPITVQEDTPKAPAPATAPIPPPSPEQLRQNKRDRDRSALLNRG